MLKESHFLHHNAKLTCSVTPKTKAICRHDINHYLFKDFSLGSDYGDYFNSINDLANLSSVSASISG